MTIASQYQDRIRERLAPQIVDVVGFERGSLAVRLLTDEQVSEAKIAAYQHIEAQCKIAKIRLLDFVEVDAEAFDRERVVQMVHRAFVDAESIEDEFMGATEAFLPSKVRGFDSVSVDDLYDAYLAYQATRAIKVELNPAEVDALLVQLREPGNEAVLSMLDATALRTLVLAIARRG